MLIVVYTSLFKARLVIFDKTLFYWFDFASGGNHEGHDQAETSNWGVTLDLAGAGIGFCRMRESEKRRSTPYKGVWKC